MVESTGLWGGQVEMCFWDLIDIILPGKFSQSILEKDSAFSRTEYDMEITTSLNTFY